ncbi:MAG: alkaline phosphatase family protein [Gammaproteobacteria bacterium]
MWLARLLQLPDSDGDRERPGLLMVQIDGLSRPELEWALERGEVPFLKRLMRRHDYCLHSLYSGLPSTTPAVQSELFYGIRCAVPAFSFRDHETGRVIRMYEPAAAIRQEAQQDPDGDRGLLAGGSAYADAVTGGAAEAHFCASAMGWGPALRSANPIVVFVFLISNLYSFLRVAVLLVLESGLALYDFVRGLFDGYDFAKELKFIPTRVAISILLRELCVIGAKIDVSRGLPVVHLNLLGYDEQAHRRGPRSRFAHWTLKGIDDAVARLWRAAQQSRWRRYQVWLYSDHGQAAVRTFEQVRGLTLEDAVFAALESLDEHTLRSMPGLMESIQTHRVRLLGGNRVQSLFGVLGINGDDTETSYPHMAALGPVAHIYLPAALTRDEHRLVARELAQRHGVPLVLVRAAAGVLQAFAEDGQFELPDDAAQIFGAGHPFIEGISEDIVCLCEHPDAGDIVALGWRDGIEPLTFATENGAHGGASPDETHAFTLLPAGTHPPGGGRDYLRPASLREAALRYLQRSPGEAGGSAEDSLSRSQTRQ